MRPPRLRCTLFPLIYPPHLLVLPATFGLHLLLQTYPYFRALYVISVRRTKSLLTASFRFHLTMDTLAVRLYTSSLPRRVRDFHPLERAHGAQTKRPETQCQGFRFIFENRCDRIRTCDLCVPNAALYQAELHLGTTVGTIISFFLLKVNITFAF